MLKVWERVGYTVEMVEYDGDLNAFEVTQGERVQTITPDSIEAMEQIIEDLDSGEDVNGWEDGMGNVINVK